MARTQYARDMISNFQRRLAIEQLFTEMMKLSTQDAAVTMIKLQSKLRQPRQLRNVG